MKKIDFKKIPYKNIAKTLFIVLISFYALWNLSQEVVGRFWLQGRNFTVLEIIRQAKNEECVPFSVFSEDEAVNLINIDCLQQAEEE